MSCGADVVANQLLKSLVGDKDFTITPVDFSGPEWDIPNPSENPLFNEIKSLTVEDLTQSKLDGSGVFDVLMKSVRAHLRDEYDKGRITGADYTKSYISLTQAVIGGSIQFLLSRDQAYWAAVQGQIGSIAGRVQLQTAKVNYQQVILEALNQEANYARTKIQLATDDEAYCAAKYNVEFILPAQWDMMKSQKEGQDKQNAIASYNLTSMLPSQKQMLDAQKLGQDKQNEISTYNLATMLPAQKLMLDAQKEGQVAQNSTTTWNLANMLPAQKKLVDAQVEVQEGNSATITYNLSEILPEQKKLTAEQAEAARAQTVNTRFNSDPVNGTMGAQRMLNEQQKLSFVIDGQLKVFSALTGPWSARKTVDEGIETPNAVMGPNIDSVAKSLQSQANLPNNMIP